MTSSLRRVFACAAAIVGALGAAAAAHAHPHVWASVKSEVIYDDDQRVAGFRHHWTFDEYYSAFAVQGLDRNRNGKYDPDELAPLANENVSSLKEYDYFTFPLVDDEAATLLDPIDHSLDYADGRLTLHFTLPLKTPVDGRLGVVSVSVYDPTYYVAFVFAEGAAVTLAANAPDSCRAELGRDAAAAPATAAGETALSEAFFQALDGGSDYGAQFAQSARIRCDGMPKS